MRSITIKTSIEVDVEDVLWELSESELDDVLTGFFEKEDAVRILSKVIGETVTEAMLIEEILKKLL